MNTEITGNSETRGWIFYDADCAHCARLAGRAGRTLAQRGFVFLPLQTPGAADRVGVTLEALAARMHLLMADGRWFAGADAFVEIARHVRWAKPVVLAARMPAVLALLRRGYDWIAANRRCLDGTCRIPRRRMIVDWLPIALLPLLALAFRPYFADWVLMWALALALYVGCKWLTYRYALAAGEVFAPGKARGYLLAWVGMDPAPFLSTDTPVVAPAAGRWIAAAGKTVLGAGLVWFAARVFLSPSPLAAGWLGMAGLVLLLHFGLFDLLALDWQRRGAAAQPLMRSPLLTRSLGEFWGARWNSGFHTLAHRWVFRPLRRRMGAAVSMLLVFLASGLIHEVVITMPARGGYGLPTAYFLTQGLGLMLERSSLGRRLGLGAGLRGRSFALVVAAAPAFWLFPPVFVRNVILPMLDAIGAV